MLLSKLQFRVSKNLLQNSHIILKNNSNKLSTIVINPGQKVKDNPDFWVRSPYPPIKLLTGVTLPELLFEKLGKWENATAFTCDISNKSYTYSQFYKMSNSFATALLNSGLKRKDVVTLCLPNIPEFPAIIFGCWTAGIIPSPINPIYTKLEMGKSFDLVESKAVITISSLVPTVKEAIKDCKNKIKSIIVVGEPQEGCHTFNEMIKTISNPDLFLKGSQIDTSEEIALLPFSSGTTGPPKAVELTHASLVTNTLMHSYPKISRSKPFHSGNEQEKYLGILPLFHGYGSNLIMTTSIFHGGHLVILPKFDPQLFVDTLNREKFTLMHLVTPLLNFMVNSQEITPEAYEKIHTFFIGATPVGEKLIEAALKKVPDGKNIMCQEGYGMTELSPASNIVDPKWGNNKIGSCGAPLPGVECKIVDIQTGETLGKNQKGELYVRGPLLMKGYHKNKKATEETFEDGWLKTGDVARFDDDDCFFIVDRLKELIKVKGLQVSPSELEDILRLHPKIKDVAVIGVPHEKDGESPRAYVVKSENDNLNENEINNYINKLVAPFKQLKGGIEFVENIPKTPAGKILRKDLKADFIQKSKC